MKKMALCNSFCVVCYIGEKQHEKIQKPKLSLYKVPRHPIQT